jgi:signal transduction histidine kinase
MVDDFVKKHGMPYVRFLLYLCAVISLSVLLFFAVGRIDLAETSIQSLQQFEPLEFDELLIVAVFLVIALSAFTIRLWIELKRVVQEYNTVELLLYRSGKKLSFLNTIIREDILNQLTQLSGELEQTGQRADTNKVKTAINKIRRQIKFTKEYQDIGTTAAEWQNVADTIMRAKVGVDLGKVTFDVEIRDMEIYADRLLEKAFFYLIDNALKHGGEKLSRIRFYSKVSEDKFIIVCQDDGVGMPVDKKGLHFPKESGRPAGYGLFLIKEILAETNIGIRETGISGTGARFEIDVPPGVYRQV